MKILTRIFVSFWAAIVLIAAAAVGLTVANFKASAKASADRPSVVTREAGEVLKRDGLVGLRVWLAERNRSHREQRTLIIDSTGRDILGQRMPQPRHDFGDGGRRPDRGDFGPPPPGSGPPPDAGSNSSDGRQQRPPFGPPPGDFSPGGPPQGPMHWPMGGPGSQITGPDGERFRVIFDPPPRMGPFSPPFSWSVRLGLLALALAISGLVSYLLARSISAPVRRLQAAAHTLSSGKLDARAGPDVTARRDELGVLGREFDSMADRLSTLIAARQRLLRDISHELRSPLARMELAIGLARQDPQSTPEQIDRIQREAERLDQLIGHMLDYARLERDPATFNFESVDVTELIRQVVHDAQFESQSSPDRITFTADATFVMRGDPYVLHAAIDNVVRNALLHGDATSPINVTLSLDAEAAHIAVRDHGHGVLEADLPRIFEPFYRAGSLDSKHVSTTGTGIGLAITQRAAALHGGRVSARNAAGGGLIVTITLPRTIAH